MADSPTSAPTLEHVARIAGARIINATQMPTHVSSISLDSARVEPGGLFAAVPGTRVHGASFAFDSPAAATLTDEAGLALIQKTSDRRPILVVDDVRAVLGDVSAEIYGHPSKQLTVLGVTGTSGKTTTTYLLEKGLMSAGHTTGIIGTTGTRIDGREVPTKLTTPEAPTLQALFASMLAEGVTHVVMEVSSHALSLGRVDGTEFAVAGFTNLSQDHLDFHPTMEDYFAAKARFFDPASSVAGKQSVICVDDEWGERMAEVASAPFTVGTHGQANVSESARRTNVEASGAQSIELTIGTDVFNAHISLPGDFNVANAALATGMAHCAGVDVEKFLSGIESAGVPGRMERIDEGQDFVAVVDYAHKPGAVAAVLNTLRAQVNGRLGVIVGAGGDRDSSKRPLMGAEAVKRADYVIITDDNPRSEDPALIRAAVVDGARAEAEAQDRDVEVVEIASRADAIDALIAWAEPGDAVVVTGKGHEVGQIVGDQVHHFDDREEVRRALGELRAAQRETTEEEQ
ncbi:UDP-N-acetylmuramoyl-L-alanyl-D-glutamate--2,6-diaminopimelate ligase [Corynebacterium lubricantis]|uniref:UDP-N-acetylmuramoyl-L-alanyl-D-glutamate--2, 6-diaminopimelate ligase n=1 Tax=Corynebacterium lubricantis TaxID=541095 RepID=UPI0003669349|nr:UDP-N-acetylmuramoyl-L-alanyl-D-glutamate--2,6-diaminopimelate ligase [Corynebacterium lubricantis]